MLESIFTKLLILSVQAGFLILATIIIRGIFKKIPRKYICLLWCMAALRLLIPVTIESPVSLVPTESTIQEAFVEEPLDDYRIQRAEQMIPAIAPSELIINNETEYIKDMGTEAVAESAIAGNSTNVGTLYTYEPEKKAPDFRMLMIYLWLFGVVILLGYGVFTYVRVRLKVRDAVHLEENVWLSDRIDTPFLLGYVKPRIYMPFFVDESRREYIIAHEMGHIRRGDHITKLIGYILLAVYWFQPLVWIAYVMFCKDVEMACDEKVIGNLGEEKKKAYSQTLLLCSVDKHYLLANPLAFGEIDVKKRITNVLSYKKPGVIISIVSVVVLLLAAVFFMTSSEEREQETTQLSDSAIENSEGAGTEAESTVLAEYQLAYLKSLEMGAETRLAVIPLNDAEEPLLLLSTGSYKDPAFDNAEVSFAAEYCMFGEVKSINTGGTAYPIRADYEAVYLGSGHSLSVLTISDEADEATGKLFMETTVYSENDDAYAEMMDRYHVAPVVEFNVRMMHEDIGEKVSALEEQQEQLVNAMEEVVAEKEKEEAVLANLTAQLNEQLEQAKAMFAALQLEQTKQEEFGEKYGVPVTTKVRFNTEEEFISVAKELFDEYMKMDSLFSSTLYTGAISDYPEDYIEVNYEQFPDAESVKDYIRQFCTEEMTNGWYADLFEGEYPALKEVDGKLYTAFYDGIPTAYSEYDSISILEAYSSRIVYTIWPSAPFFEERDTTYFVQMEREADSWVVAECSPVMTKGSHDYYPETVHTRLDMGDYEVVLQDYTTREGGPLEVAIIRGDESETLEVLYEEWQRDAAKVRVADAGEIFGYDCFYVYDFGLSHTVTTDFYAVVDGELKHLATSFGDDPENNTFIRDLNGDGMNELICNLTYSADGRQGVRIYKRDGEQILYDYGGYETLVGLDAEYAGYANSYYDAEIGKIVVCGYKDNEHQELPWEIDLSVLEFGKYTPGY